jgi:hypothetical protein
MRLVLRVRLAAQYLNDWRHFHVAAVMSHANEECRAGDSG